MSLYTYRSCFPMERSSQCRLYVLMLMTGDSFTGDFYPLSASGFRENGHPLWGWAAVAPKHFHFAMIPLKVDHLGGKKFQKLSHCDRSILLQYHTRIQWVSLNLSQIFVKADSMVRCLILYTRGNEWKHLNSKFKRRNPVLFTIT